MSVKANSFLRFQPVMPKICKLFESKIGLVQFSIDRRLLPVIISLLTLCVAKTFFSPNFN